MTRRTTSRPTSAAAAAVLALSLGVLGACSSDDEGTADDAASSSPSPSASTTPTPSPEQPSPSVPGEPAGPVLDVQVSGSDVGPNAEELALEVGEPLTLRIRSDRAGELHVHSRPEQYVGFGAGRSEHELVVESPGVVEVEEHESGVVIAVLRVGG